MSNDIRAALAEIREEQRAQRKLLEGLIKQTAEFYQETFPGSVSRPSILERLDKLERNCAVHHGNGGTLPPR